MATQGTGPTYTAMKWSLFAVLFCVAPAPVIVFERFMTGPVIFVAATAVALIADSLRPAGAGGVEITGYVLVHLAIYLFLYGVLASAAAWALTAIGNRAVRWIAFAVLAAGCAMVGLAPLYGGAGLHGGAFGTITFFFEVLDRSHFGPHAAVLIYGLAALAALALGAAPAFGWWQRNRARGDP